MNSTPVTTNGEGEPPIRLTVHSAMSLPAPVTSIALDTGIMPANRKMVTQSIEAYACFSVKQPVSTQTRAPMIAAISKVIPLMPRAITRTTASRITPETICLDLEVSFASISCSISWSASSCLFGSKYLPTNIMYSIPATETGIPIQANSKKPKGSRPAAVIAPVAMMLGGVPTMVMIPPQPQANANGIN